MTRKRQHYGLWAAWFLFVTLLALAAIIGGAVVAIHVIGRFW